MKLSAINVELFLYTAIYCLSANSLHSMQILTDSHETENMGYYNYDHNSNGEYDVIKKLVIKNSIVIDAGAHTGSWSNLVLEHTENVCTIYCFEPILDFFNALLNNLGNKILAYNCALGKEETSKEINYFYQEGQQCSTLFQRDNLNYLPVKKITVPITSLNKFCRDNGIELIDLLKIDTEGAELDILQGASEMISNKKIRFIQFEYGGCYADAKTTFHQVFNYLTSNGYFIYRIAPNSLIQIPQWRDGLENFTLSNYLASVVVLQ